ncbi:beta-lactamase domain protein [Leadbetterella byssophila DSM 17132]|uniref:Beta-lactamase domain protein n=1 Tax=Leadbetterella byssophila (strain DSM 17132 / JCM 16389 / KACC 11308 / NBRC 106382 / 4M15) TaxID=649349 RepID=E4RWX4_LEAB4|nr:MBL fold metallo-hydrolase [Leadbetterella byssophila]ADQ17180.1 beta-lactamase domain protein [Leadbetterella byssophila DSM 17132]
MITSFVFSPFQENTYVLTDPSGETIVVDPGCYTQAEKEQLKEFLKPLNVKAILLTHAHLDHIFGVAYLKRHYDVPVYMHKLDLPILADFEMRCKMWGIPGAESFEAEKFLEEGDVFTFGQTQLEVLHVPGHAPGHIVFVSHENEMIIGGDCLFRRSIGRTDLPMGDHDTLINSIKTKLFSLPDHYTVYPGHMEPTTIGEEKQFNPFLRQ